MTSRAIVICPLGRLIDRFTADQFGHHVLPQFRDRCAEHWGASAMAAPLGRAGRGDCADAPWVSGSSRTIRHRMAQKKTGWFASTGDSRRACWLAGWSAKSTTLGGDGEIKNGAP
jgi:hypothetical protein